jgi:hypothetical protein
MDIRSDATETADTRLKPEYSRLASAAATMTMIVVDALSARAEQCCLECPVVEYTVAWYQIKMAPFFASSGGRDMRWPVDERSGL